MSDRKAAKVYLKRLSGWRYWLARLRRRPVVVPASVNDIIVDVTMSESTQKQVRAMAGLYGIPEHEALTRLFAEYEAQRRNG